MADTKTIEERHDIALARIAKALNVEALSLIAEARGEPALGRAMTMENIADVLAGKVITDKPPVVAKG